MQSILITGVAGLIGSRMAEWVMTNYPEYEVIGIDNLSGGYKENLPKGITFIQLDLAKDELDIAFTGKNVQFVFHFAAYAAEGLSPFIRRFNYSNNLVATANLVNKCIEYNINIHKNINDIFKRAIYKKYRKIILEQGDVYAADKLLVDFLGRKPNNKAFFKHLGLN